MAIRKKLTKFGNSLAVIIDKPVISLLQWDESSEIEISTPNGKDLVLKAVNKRDEAVDTKQEAKASGKEKRAGAERAKHDVPSVSEERL